MKNILLAVFTAGSIAHPVGQVVAAERYRLDPMHTNIIWKVKHFGFSSPSGKFTEVEGTFILDEKNLENSSVNVTVYPKSILTGIAKFNEHLMSTDFFNVEKYNTVTFKSSHIEKTGKDTANIYGELTLLGVTKPVMLEAILNKVGVNPMNNIKTAGFSASTTINRSEFGMSWGVPNISDSVSINIEVEGTLDEPTNEGETK